ncbi:MAG TPA: efflux RND transporter periplasmic adaptor subunit, partial [Blastocatellia bacterium]|nr:efflux RND transporter periplasmic adaptor subunit [Blastocatellia bacterium]
ASGFVKRYLVDIGDRVKAGQVLAELETPDLDQQVNQARQEVESATQDVAQAQQELEQSRATLERTKATLAQARANAELAQITLNRTKSLLESGVVTRQLIDEQQAIYNVRSADVGAAQAQVQEQQAAINARQAMLKSKQSAVNARRSNLQRLVDLQGFRRVTAPYDGVITARGIEVGSLISNNGMPVGTVGNAANAANAANNGIFRITRVEKMRLFVAVPQTYAPAISIGQKVSVSVRELPNRQFEGRVARTTQALDPATRTLSVTIQVENKDFSILPGMYTQVKFELPGLNQNAVLIPGSALISRAAGPQVATVRKDGTLHFEKVVIGRDSGAQIEILSGLSSDSQVVTNPTDALQEGQKVEVNKSAKK